MPPLKSAEALTVAGMPAVGNAHNVNYGAPAIRSSLRRLDEIGIFHTGAGVSSSEARQPVIVERDGVRFGCLQRTSVYWSHGHEATATYPGVATIRAQTAYRPQIEQLHVATDDGALVRAAFSFVRHNAQNKTVPHPIAAEQAELDHLRHLSARFNPVLEVEGDEVVVWPKP